jgi:hypothetical protein
LKKQLLYYVNQINFIEQNNNVFFEIQNNIKNNLNELSYNKSHSVNKKSSNILYINKNKNNSKSFLVNNKIYKGFSQNNNINNEKLIGIDIADKKLEKQLSKYLTENNSENNFIINNNCKDENKNILNIIYQSKKGVFKFGDISNKNNNNKMKNEMKNHKKETSFKSYNKNNLLGKGKNNIIYFYTNKENNQKVSVNQNKVINNEYNAYSKFDIQYKNLNERMINLFNSCFDYINSNQ